MPGSLSHSPAKVVQQLLVDLGHGGLPASNSTWTIEATQEPTRPDKMITIYDTTGRTGNRDTPTGERPEYNGIQVRVRDVDAEVAYAKALGIALAFDTDVKKTAVTVSDRSGTGSSTYTVWSIRRTSDVLTVGKESPTSNRVIYTLNAEVSLRQI